MGVPPHAMLLCLRWGYTLFRKMVGSRSYAVYALLLACDLSHFAQHGLSVRSIFGEGCFWCSGMGVISVQQRSQIMAHFGSTPWGSGSVSAALVLPNQLRSANGNFTNVASKSITHRPPTCITPKLKHNFCGPKTHTSIHTSAELAYCALFVWKETRN